MDPSKENIEKLCRQAFDDHQKDVEASMTALRSIANTLLLHSEARQIFVDTGYAPKAADRLKVNGDNREDEMFCSRILFLLTYNTNLNFDPLFEGKSLAQNIHRNLEYHAETYTSNNLQDKGLDTHTPKPSLEPIDHRALTETLKLLFNVTQFYPHKVYAFTKTISPILSLLHHIPLPTPTLQPPITPLINALLNLDLPSDETSPLFPPSSQTKHTQRLISILSSGLSSSPSLTSTRLEILATPLLTLLRRVTAIAPPPARTLLQTSLLPSASERARPLGKSNTLASQLLQLSTSPSAPNLKEAVSSLLFELSGSDPLTFTRNVGYGYAAGFLMTHDIPAPEGVLSDVGDEVTTVDGQEVNPITGQRRDMEPEDLGPEMTDEEKEREAEKLFVLFERLKATGVVNVVNPVQQAVQEGRFEEVD